MGGVSLIDHASRIERSWAVIVEGDGYYRADVLALPLANEEPPPFMSFHLLPVPEHLAGQVTLVDWFMAGATPHVALRACELVSAELTKITDAEFVALETQHRVEDAKRLAVTNPAATLEAIDFAGPPRPNRAQRRASSKGKRR